VYMMQRPPRCGCDLWSKISKVKVAVLESEWAWVALFYLLYSIAA